MFRKRMALVLGLLALQSLLISKRVLELLILNQISSFKRFKISSYDRGALPVNESPKDTLCVLTP